MVVRRPERGPGGRASIQPEASGLPVDARGGERPAEDDVPEAYRFRAIDAVLVVLRDHTETPRTERLDERRSIRYGPDGRPVAVELRHVSSGVVLEGLPSRLVVSVLLRRLGVEIVDEGL